MKIPTTSTNSSAANPVIPILEQLNQFCLIMFASFAMFSISLTQIAFALGAISWLLKVHLTNGWKDLEGTFVGICILCFCLASVLAITSSVDLKSSLINLKKMVQFIIFFWVINAVRNEKQRNLLAILIIIAGVITSLIGLSAYFGGTSIKPGWIQGTRSVPATFTGALMVSGLMTMGRFLFHKPKEYWVFGSLGIISFCILFSMVRQVWLGCLIGALFLVFFWGKKYLLVIPLLVGLLMFSHESINKRVNSFTNIKDQSLQKRIATWKGGWKIFKDHPILGCGFKCVDYIHSQYPDPSGNIARYRGMHSNILQLLVDTGIVGTGTWISIWIAYFIEILKRWRALALNKVQDNSKAIIMGSAAVVLAFLTGGFFESSIYDSEVAMLQYFIMGCSLAQTKESSGSN